MDISWSYIWSYGGNMVGICHANIIGYTHIYIYIHTIYIYIHMAY